MATALPEDFWETEDQANAELDAIVSANGLGQFNETADLSEETDEVSQETEATDMESDLPETDAVSEEKEETEETDEDEAVRKLTERKDKNFY